MNKFLSAFLIFLAFTTGTTLAQSEQNDTNTTPADVYRFTLQLSQTLQDISLEMGIEPRRRQTIEVRRVSPREVYFQAATLYQKSSQLMFEFSGKEGPPITELYVNASPDDVLGLLKAVELHLEAVKQVLGGRYVNPNVTLDDTKTPTDVYKLIVDLNRMINDLSEFRFSPAHVHQKITEAIAISASILATYPDATAVFHPNTNERRKRPQDVYNKIAHMYDNMLPVMAHFNKHCLVLGELEKTRDNIVPGDVYDLAVLLVSQLRYMHTLIPDTPPIKNSYFPGKVIPSEVYQRLSILEQQMTELIRVNDIKLRRPTTP